jgi:ActR/RegA family two-component response regulator
MPSLLPDREDLVRTFTDAVAAAVEATIVERTRTLLAERAVGKGPKSPKITMSDRALEAPVLGDWPTLAQHQWTYIQRVLTRTNGNRSEAAVILGLHRRSLQRLLARGSARARARGKRPGRKRRT